MKRLVAALVAIVLAALYVASCTATMTYTAIAYSHLRATQYNDGEPIKQPFPVLVVIPSRQPGGRDEIHSVRLNQLPRFLRKHGNHSFHLPGKTGELPPRDKNDPGVKYAVLEQNGNTQVIEVEDHGDAHTYYARYEATENTISPRYFRVWASLYGIVGLPIGLVLTTLLFYGAKRLVREKLRTLAPHLHVGKLSLSQAATEWLFVVSAELLKREPKSS